jgi:hypothetical protein
VAGQPYTARPRQAQAIRGGVGPLHSISAPTRNQLDQAVRIDQAIDAPFPLDLIVRTPKNLARRLEEGDSFLREIVTRGKVLYEYADSMHLPYSERERGNHGHSGRCLNYP